MGRSLWKRSGRSWWSGACKGDSFAWTELVKAHHRRVYGLCFRFTGSATDAEDLTQEVFLKVYGNLAAFDLARGHVSDVDHDHDAEPAGGSFPPVAGAAGDGFDGRGLGRRRREMPLSQRLADKGPTQHDRAVQKEIEKMVQEALTRISPELREAVILRDLQDMDYKEIAQVLRIPEGTVKSRISRGRAELARLLERNKGQVV